MVTLSRAIALSLFVAFAPCALQANESAPKRSLLSRFMRNPAVVALASVYLISPALESSLFRPYPSSDSVGMRFADKFKCNIKKTADFIASAVNYTKQTAETVEKSIKDNKPKVVTENVRRNVEAKADEAKQTAKTLSFFAQYKLNEK